MEKDTTKVVILELLQKVPLNSSHNLSTTITLNNSHIMFVQFQYSRITTKAQAHHL